MKLAMETAPSHVASVCATLDSKYNVCGGRGGREGEGGEGEEGEGGRGEGEVEGRKVCKEFE